MIKSRHRAMLAAYALHSLMENAPEKNVREGEGPKSRYILDSISPGFWSVVDTSKLDSPDSDRVACWITESSLFGTFRVSKFGKIILEGSSKVVSEFISKAYGLDVEGKL